VTEPADAAPRRPHRRRRTLLALWSVIVAVLLLWQTLSYRGVIALAAEWQFDAFGRYYPSLTYVLLVVLLSWPILWLLRARPGAEADALPGRGFIRALLALAAGCGAAALVVLAALWSLPGIDGSPRRVVVGTPSAALPAPGATLLVGDIVADRIAGFSEDVLVARHSVRFAPLVAPGANGGAVRFFVEITGAEALATARREGAIQGVLRRGGLPGELERLFRYAGIDIANPYYVLFAGVDAMRWPYRLAAIELLLAGFACALVAFLLHLRRERARNARADAAEWQPAP